jgi:peptide/nickel transport system permease protein
MISFIGRKVAAVVITLLVALSIAFLLGRASGNPIGNILGPFAQPAQIVALTHKLGLNQPLIVQYLHYLASTLTGHLGDSLQFDEANRALILSRLPYTAELLAGGMIVATVAGIPLGVLAARREGTWWDRVASVIALLGQSVPVFWLALMAILVVALRLGWLPAGQAGGFSNLILPAVTLSLYPLSYITRLTRSSMLEVLHEPYIESAYARGLRPARVLWVHGLRNALLPILTVSALQTGLLISGAVVVEYVYSWPGLGSLALQAVQFRDFTLVQAVVAVGALAFVLINLAVDLLYPILDPRLR